MELFKGGARTDLLVSQYQDLQFSKVNNYNISFSVLNIYFEFFRITLHWFVKFYFSTLVLSFFYYFRSIFFLHKFVSHMSHHYDTTLNKLIFIRLLFKCIIYLNH